MNDGNYNNDSKYSKVAKDAYLNIQIDQIETDRKKKMEQVNKLIY